MEALLLSVYGWTPAYVDCRLLSYFGSGSDASTMHLLGRQVFERDLVFVHIIGRLLIAATLGLL